MGMIQDREGSSLDRRPAATAVALLTHRHLPAMAAALAMLLAMPSLGVGWVLDDYYHRTVLLGTSRVPGPARAALGDVPVLPRRSGPDRLA